MNIDHADSFKQKMQDGVERAALCMISAYYHW